MPEQSLLSKKKGSSFFLLTKEHKKHTVFMQVSSFVKREAEKSNCNPFFSHVVTMFPYTTCYLLLNASQQATQCDTVRKMVNVIFV